MVRSIKQQLFSWLGAAALTLGFAQSSQAQSIIWGTGHSNPQIDSMGEFAKTNTDTTLNGTGWSTVQVTTAPWQWSNTGRSLGPYSSTSDTIHSPTRANGIAFFDSDRADATFHTGQEAYLYSPLINATGFKDSLVVLKFYTKMRDFQTDSARVAFSTNGGVTWTNSTDVMVILGTTPNGADVEDWVMVNLASAFAGVNDLDSCKIRFHFAGNSYYWSIDDVSLETVAPYQDLVIDAIAAPAVPSNYAVHALSQVNSTEYSWGAKVINRGVLTAPASKLRINISLETSPGVWTSQVVDSVTVPTLAVDSSFSAFEVGIGAGWLPTVVGNYRARYYIDVPVSQSDMTNDTFDIDFEISADDYMSKVPRAASGFPAATTGTIAVAGAGNRLAEFEYGSLYYFPTGATDSVTLNQVKGVVIASNVAPGSTSAVVGAKIYKWYDNNADHDWDFSSPDGGAELAIVGLGIDTTVSLSPTGVKNLAIDVISIDGTRLCLEDTSFYVVTIAQSNASGLVNSTGKLLGVYVGVYEDINYLTNTQSLPVYPYYNSILRKAECTGTSGACSTPYAVNRWGIFAGAETNTPSIGLVLTRCSAPVSVNKTEIAQNFLIFPNPTTGHLNVQVEFEGTQKFVQYVMTDVTGRVVVFQTNKNVQSETTMFNVENIPTGVYFMTIRTEKGASTQRFVKQ